MWVRLYVQGERSPTQTSEYRWYEQFCSSDRVFSEFLEDEALQWGGNKLYGNDYFTYGFKKLKRLPDTVRQSEIDLCNKKIADALQYKQFLVLDAKRHKKDPKPKVKSKPKKKSPPAKKPSPKKKR